MPWSYPSSPKGWAAGRVDIQRVEFPAGFSLRKKREPGARTNSLWLFLWCRRGNDNGLLETTNDSGDVIAGTCAATRLPLLPILTAGSRDGSPSPWNSGRG